MEDVGFFSGGYPAEDVFSSHMTFVYKSQTIVPKGHGSQISLFKRLMFRSRNFELINCSDRLRLDMAQVEKFYVDI